MAKLVPRYLSDQDFRTQVAFITHGDQSEIFKRTLFDHERMFFDLY